MATPDASTEHQISSQYHHFVPQFILKNFAHEFELQQPAATKRATKQKRGGKKANRKRYNLDSGNLKRHDGDPVVNNVNLQIKPYIIDESPVRHILGLTDMYRDKKKGSKFKEQHEVEDMFSKIEDKASRIFRKITKGVEEGNSSVCLPRSERDLIRKFLFLLKYRGSNFHQRFSHEEVGTYSSNDKELFRDYMRDNGFTRPFQVWLQSLKTIMELEMDPDMKWVRSITKKIYPPDANWLVAHTEKMYMAICTTSEVDDEFILTDNSYNIFEGPNRFSRDPDTGKVYESSWANFHEFAPVSPKVMIVLRSAILSVPEEDRDPNKREQRRLLRVTAIDDVFGLGTKSSLEDLPITKARNSYSRIVDGRAVANPGAADRQRKFDKFYFHIFPLNTVDVHRINTILLENSYACSRIVFGSESSFLHTLEAYMTKLNIATGVDADRIAEHLQSMEQLMGKMGSTKKAHWRRIKTRDGLSEDEHGNKFREFIRYCTSTGSLDDGFFDTLRLQMLNPKGCSVQAEPRVELLSSPTFRNGPEDVFAKVRQYVQPTRLNHLMYSSAMTGIELKKLHPLDIWQASTRAENNTKRHSFIREFVLRVPGNVNKCGIERVEQFALAAETSIIQCQLHKRGRFQDLVLSDEEKMEFTIRMMVRAGFRKVLSVYMNEKVVDALEKVFFVYTYPTPPMPLS